MKTISVLVSGLLLAGCASVERISAGGQAARVSVAAYNAQAVVQAEQARTQAAIGVAQAQAMADVSVSSMWAAQVPWVVMALCLTAIVLAVLYWRGRVAVQTVGGADVAKVLSGVELRAMREFAAAQGGQIVWTPEGNPLLQVDGRRRALRIEMKK